MLSSLGFYKLKITVVVVKGPHFKKIIVLLFFAKVFSTNLLKNFLLTKVPKISSQC